MIKTKPQDIEKLKKLCPQGHLIIAISNYRGFRNFLGFLAQYVVNVLQWIVRPFYDNKKKYIAHVFTIYHKENKEVEIAYFGILEEYQNKKLGSYLLSEAIKKSFKYNDGRVWLHTCSLDHKHALNNYMSRGMKIFKTETIKI